MPTLVVHEDAIGRPQAQHLWPQTPNDCTLSYYDKMHHSLAPKKS